MWEVLLVTGWYDVYMTKNAYGQCCPDGINSNDQVPVMGTVKTPMKTVCCPSPMPFTGVVQLFLPLSCLIIWMNYLITFVKNYFFFSYFPYLSNRARCEDGRNVITSFPFRLVAALQLLLLPECLNAVQEAAASIQEPTNALPWTEHHIILTSVTLHSGGAVGGSWICRPLPKQKACIWVQKHL